MRKYFKVIVLCAVATTSMLATASAGVDYHGGPKAPFTHTTQRP